MGMNGVLGAGFGRPSIGKAVKVALGCSLAVLLARAMDLSTATAVVTITLLSVQRTKKDTLRAALRRSLAFLSALALALPLFSLLRFSVLSLGLFLLVFVPVCQWLNIEEGLAMSTVLMLHFWNAQTITAALVLNETILMAIGILMGIVMNLYIPRRTRAIREDQRITEERMRAILRDMGAFLREDSVQPEAAIPPDTHPPQPPLAPPDPIPERVPSRRGTSSQSGEGSAFPARIRDGIDALRAHLDGACKRALALADNTFHPDMRYFLQYMEMRRQQCRSLSRLAGSLARLTPDSRPFPWQAWEIGAFFEQTADSLHECSNAEELLVRLEELRHRFKASELPATRLEFEVRAVLYEAADALQHLLELKRDFTRSLTPSQVERFWSCSMRDRKFKRKPVKR